MFVTLLFRTYEGDARQYLLGAFSDSEEMSADEKIQKTKQQFLKREDLGFETERIEVQ